MVCLPISPLPHGNLTSITKHKPMMPGAEARLAALSRPAVNFEPLVSHLRRSRKCCPVSVCVLAEPLDIEERIAALRVVVLFFSLKTIAVPFVQADRFAVFSLDVQPDKDCAGLPR